MELYLVIKCKESRHNNKILHIKDLFHLGILGLLRVPLYAPLHSLGFPSRSMADGSWSFSAELVTFLAKAIWRASVSLQTLWHILAFHQL